jgi:glycosyltransferase involved in cell wall biosynthesis
VELVVSLLTEELVRRGHEVTLFASGDSQTTARLVSVCPAFLRGSGRDVPMLTLMNVAVCLEEAAGFDIIHNHTGVEGLALSGLVQTPMLSTIHGIGPGDWHQVFMFYRGWHNAISRSALVQLPQRPRCVGVVYNAIDAATYPFNDGQRQDFLLFLSRMSEEKGPHLAIEAAKLRGERIVLAGNVHPADMAYFRSQVEPLVDGDQVSYVGEADYHRKRELMASARCLLAPITWAEPFGLFMVEAMACGTPVVAFPRGAAPELIVDGVTGFLVETVAEMAEAVDRTGLIDARACRAHVEENYCVTRMVDGYLSAYNTVLAEAVPPVESLLWAA